MRNLPKTKAWPPIAGDRLVALSSLLEHDVGGGVDTHGDVPVLTRLWLQAANFAAGAPDVLERPREGARDPTVPMAGEVLQVPRHDLDGDGVGRLARLELQQETLLEGARRHARGVESLNELQDLLDAPDAHVGKLCRLADIKQEVAILVEIPYEEFTDGERGRIIGDDPELPGEMLVQGRGRDHRPRDHRPSAGTVDRGVTLLEEGIVHQL